MYSTCLFCTKSLGANEVIETLPIGRRIAFDSAQGRLWVVCRHCAKWNLVPFDTRWESIEACERVFRDTRTRYSTDNIGIARVREGLDLVRVGPALRPEFAAWRYGDQFGRRRRKNALIVAGAIVALPALFTLGIVGGTGAAMALQLPNYYLQWRLHRHVTVRIPREGELVRRPNEEMVFRVGVLGPLFTSSRLHEFSGAELQRLLPVFLARTNVWNTRRRVIADAVAIVAEQPNARELLIDAAPSVRRVSWGGKGGIGSLNATWRLAAEIACSEENERAALEGELALLERQWKEADQLARISDSLALE